MLIRWILLCLFFFSPLIAQPGPGDVYREYLWWKRSGDAGGALRVGGREGTTDWGTTVVDGYWETSNIDPKFDIDLEHAIRAEVVIEKILCHDGTTGLGILLNNTEWIKIPTPETIPKPQEQYQHHIYPSVAVPLDQLESGPANVFKMRVSDEHTWNWPQNLIYGMHIRIYYEVSKKSHPAGAVISPGEGETIGLNHTLSCERSSPNGAIQQVDFIGLYEDINWEGDGVYRQWHYHYFHGTLMHHIGSATVAPFEVFWNTEWIPDQSEPMQIAARIQDETGLIYFTEPVKDLRLDRKDFSVELCKPGWIPQQWATRKGVLEEKIPIAGDVSRAIGYQLCWASWSPGYMEGLYVNGFKVFDKEGPNYQYYAHRITIEDPMVLIPGENKIKTGKTPLYNGNMVHGMEVEFPGIMMLVKYDTASSVQYDGPQSTFYLKPNFPNPFNPRTTLEYDLTFKSPVSLKIRDTLGREVRTLVDREQVAGAHAVEWNGLNDIGDSVSSGVYVAELQAADFRETR